MAADVDAVIAALRVVLEEAQGSDATHFRVEAANRWTALLPGAWMGRWRNLALDGDSCGEAVREEFIGHVRALIAFLEASRTRLGQSRKWWPMPRRGASAQVAVTPPRPAAAPARPVNLLRVRKPMPGVH
jgi:hypothetical protein